MQWHRGASVRCHRSHGPRSLAACASQVREEDKVHAKEYLHAVLIFTRDKFNLLLRNARNAMTASIDLERTHSARGTSDKFARALTKLMRFVADSFFAKRYGHRAVVLETVAAVPGMVGATLQHLHSLRNMSEDHGWIRQLLDEAENERMHLLVFIEIAKPSRFERFLIILIQGMFYNAFFLLYLVSPRTAHRVVGYFEEEAVISYTDYLAQIESGRQANVPAPQRAIDYWNLPAEARLSDMIIAVRADEAGHRDLNHSFADQLSGTAKDKK